MLNPAKMGILCQLSERHAWMGGMGIRPRRPLITVERNSGSVALLGNGYEHISQRYRVKASTLKGRVEQEVSFRQAELTWLEGPADGGVVFFVYCF